MKFLSENKGTEAYSQFYGGEGIFWKLLTLCPWWHRTNCVCLCVAEGLKPLNLLVLSSMYGTMVVIKRSLTLQMGKKLSSKFCVKVYYLHFLIELIIKYDLLVLVNKSLFIIVEFKFKMKTRYLRFDIMLCRNWN